MSLYEQLKKNIENIIQQYTQVVSKKYQLDENELLQLFYGTIQKTTLNQSKKETKLDNVDMGDLSVERLSKCTKVELNALCKTKGLKCTGTKEVLLQRLLGKEDQPVEKKVAKTTVSKPVSKVEKKPSIIQNLLSNKENKIARKNEFGNWFYPGTRIVLNEKLCAIGVQEEDGTVGDLTDDDIEECKKYKLTYKIPNNLDKKTDLENVRIEELEQDGVEDEQELVEDDDEEEIEEIVDDE